MNWWQNQAFVEDFIQQSDEIEGEYEQRTHQEHLDAWNFIEDEKVFDEELILSAHRIIMQRLAPEIAGKWRTWDVQVGGRLCPIWQTVPERMNHFIKLFNESLYCKTQIWALECHIDFEKIHPFADGNGRTGRLLYLWHCKRINIHPIIFREKDKQGYYSLFS